MTGPQAIKLPGEDLVRKGIRDLELGIESPESLLVSIDAPRLRRLGINVPQPFVTPEHRLYELLRPSTATPRTRGTTRSCDGS
jgi:hypothetical protein